MVNPKAHAYVCVCVFARAHTMCVAYLILLTEASGWFESTELGVL